MSNDPFHTPSEELTALTKEIAEVRTALSELGFRLGQIERHVKRAFGGGSGGRPRAPGSPKLPPTAAPAPTMSAAEALAFFDGVVATSRTDGRAVAEQIIGQLDVGDLRLMATELGLPGGNKPSKRALLAAILRRVHESLLLSKNTNVTQPRSPQIQGAAQAVPLAPSEPSSSDPTSRGET